jgi:hypothetical protein
MLRNIPTAMLLIAGSAIAAILLCLLALRLFLSAVFALSGIQRRTMRRGQVLDW